MKNMPFLQCHSSNYQYGRSSSIKYIVIHYTANNGDTAEANCRYFNGKANIKSSAHIFVDEHGYYQSAKLTNTAWHCGGSLESNHHPFRGICTNANSIGIELCSRIENGTFYFKDGTISNAVAIVKELMADYKIGINNVIRHYDVTGKNCPAPFVKSEAQWKQFKKRLESEDTLMSKEYDELKGIIDGLVDHNIAKDIIIDIMGAEIQDLYGKFGEAHKVFNTVAECPEYFQDEIQECIDRGVLKGDENGNLGLTLPMVRDRVMGLRQMKLHESKCGCE